MPEQPITVVIPSRDRAEMLTSIVPSYLQGCVEKVIVVDDASEDDTPAVLARLFAMDARIVSVRNEHAIGTPASRNRGLELCDTEFVYFGEDDVELPAGYLDRVLDVARAQSAVIVGTGLRFIPWEQHEAADKWSGAASIFLRIPARSPRRGWTNPSSRPSASAPSR